MLYAAEWPERVAALVLVAPAPLVTMPVGDGVLFTRVRAWLDETGQRELAAWMKRTFDVPARLKDDESRLAEHFAAFGPLYVQARRHGHPDAKLPGSGAARGFLQSMKTSTPSPCSAAVAWNERKSSKRSRSHCQASSTASSCGHL